MEIVKEWRYKDGKIKHDGDCFFWDRKVCTCGLLSHLCFVDEPEKHYPDFHSHFVEHMQVMDHVLRHPPAPLPVLSKEEADEFLDKLIKALPMVGN